jgi:putative exosortase-associated protein (TIGR04073 family)
MKKAWVLFFAIVIFVSYGYAEEKKPEAAQGTRIVSETPQSGLDTRDVPLAKTPFNKLTRGAVNTATFLCEVPASIWYVSENRNPLAGWTIGAVEGAGIAAMRLGSGLFDLVTFAFPPYNKPLMKPEYAFESAIDKMSY